MDCCRQQIEHRCPTRHIIQLPTLKFAGDLQECLVSQISFGLIAGLVEFAYYATAHLADVVEKAVPAQQLTGVQQ